MTRRYKIAVHARVAVVCPEATSRFGAAFEDGEKRIYRYDEQVIGAFRLRLSGMILQPR